MEIYHCDIMTSKREKMKIIAAAIGAILMEEGGGIAIKPTTLILSSFLQ